MCLFEIVDEICLIRESDDLRNPVGRQIGRLKKDLGLKAPQVQDIFLRGVPEVAPVFPAEMILRDSGKARQEIEGELLRKMLLDIEAKIFEIFGGAVLLLELRLLHFRDQQKQLLQFDCTFKWFETISGSQQRLELILNRLKTRRMADDVPVAEQHRNQVIAISPAEMEIAVIPDVSLGLILVQLPAVDDRDVSLFEQIRSAPVVQSSRSLVGKEQ